MKRQTDRQTDQVKKLVFIITRANFRSKLEARLRATGSAGSHHKGEPHSLSFPNRETDGWGDRNNRLTAEQTDDRTYEHRDRRTYLWWTEGWGRRGTWEGN